MGGFLVLFCYKFKLKSDCACLGSRWMLMNSLVFPVCGILDFPVHLLHHLLHFVPFRTELIEGKCLPLTLNLVQACSSAGFLLSSSATKTTQQKTQNNFKCFMFSFSFFSLTVATSLIVIATLDSQSKCDSASQFYLTIFKHLL